ncbi:hypothetical protein [Streptomyces sp. NPDC055140]
MLLDALETFNADLGELNTARMRFHSRLLRLEDARSPTPAHSHRPDRDPTGSLFDAVESINGELAGLAARLTEIENPGTRAQPQPRLFVICPRACSEAVRAANGLQAGKAVPCA